MSQLKSSEKLRALTTFRDSFFLPAQVDFGKADSACGQGLMPLGFCIQSFCLRKLGLWPASHSAQRSAWLAGNSAVFWYRERRWYNCMSEAPIPALHNFTIPQMPLHVGLYLQCPFVEWAFESVHVE